MFEDAIPFFERAIEGRKVSEGESSMNHAMAKAMAAGAYREAQQYDKADQYLQDAYVQVAMEYGEDNITCSAILNSQGLLYKQQQRFERAKDSYERALDIRVRHFGEDHPETCATRHNLGELLVSMNAPEKAQEYFNENVVIMEKRTSKEKEEAEAARKHTENPII